MRPACDREKTRGIAACTEGQKPGRSIVSIVLAAFLFSLKREDGAWRGFI
ncbi:hypothetical protein GBL_2899 [Geobacillus kaustophilus GBlys]|uniref:Uncharacterized protein n=1 Tax=Geobacillus kaustophilus GBlys TaxID=1337888 RepID=U2X7A0_GEOKU|nr:hypothetical protein GBL_2899 [Geobacillus kaustophilus GBlys]